MDNEHLDEYHTEPPPDRPIGKSRLIGVLLLFLGALMTAVILGGEVYKQGGRMFTLIVLLASSGSWLGLLLFPWTEGMVSRFKAESNFMIACKTMPAFWKAWSLMAVVIGIAAFILTVKASGR